MTRNKDSTKSSGELEEILDDLLNKFGDYLRGQPLAFNKERAKTREAIEAWHTTQTTKLQAEARIEVVRDLLSKANDAGAVTIRHQDGASERSKVVMEFELRSLLDKLEREHKIGEDDE